MMFVLTMKFDKKKAVFAIVMAALVLIGIVLLAGAHSAAVGNGAKSEPGNVKSESSRVAYFAYYGWEVQSPALNCETVMIPRTFSEVFDNYNQLQLSQGFDLSRYCGMELQLYTYKVTNHPDGGEVLGQLYVYKGQPVGGDIHSTALDGFMCAIKSEPPV